MDEHDARGLGRGARHTTRTPVASELLDVDGVAARLGVNPRHVRRLVAERRIPFIKWGHLLRFEPADVERWIEEQRIDALPPRQR